MKTCWTKGLTPERIEVVRKEFLGASVLRKRLSELCLERIETSYSQTISKDSYQNPNWAYIQADARGYERALHEILSLLE